LLTATIHNKTVSDKVCQIYWVKQHIASWCHAWNSVTLFQVICHFPCKLHAFNAITTVCTGSAPNCTKRDGRVGSTVGSYLGGPGSNLGPNTGCLYCGFSWFSSLASDECRNDASN
jgi:hypothetical protein